MALSAGHLAGRQDAFALENHRRAVEAQDAGRFADEIVPVTVLGERGRETVVAAGEVAASRHDGGALARLRPVFEQPSPDPRNPDVPPAGPGTVTAGNAPGITDGGAATVVASERAVERHGLRPLARIVG